MKLTLKLFLSLTVLSLFIPPTIFAVSFNKTPTATPGPGSYFFEDFTDDPTYEVYKDVSHPLTIDLINTAYIVGWEPSKFLPQFDGEEKYLNKSWFHNQDDAIIDLGLVDVFGSTALENDVILAKDEDTVPTYIRLNTSPADTYGNPFNESCYYSNEGDRQKCLEEHDALFENGSINIFSISTPLERSLPLKTQTLLNKKQSQKRIDCSSDDSKKNIECDNYYLLKEGIDERQVAKNTLDTSYEEYLDNPKDHEDIFAQKTGDGGIVPFAYVVTKETNQEEGLETPGFLGTIIDLFKDGDPQSFPIVAIGWIPTIRGTATNTQTLRNTFFPYALQESNDTALYDYLQNAIEWSGVIDLKQAFIKKAKQTPHMIASTDPEHLQFTGASIKTEPDPIFKFMPKFKLKDPKNAISEEITIYKTTLILPKHIIQKNEYLEKLSQSLFPKILTSFPESFQEIPFDNSYQTAEFNQEVEEPCPEGQTTDPDGNCNKYATINWKHEVNKSGVLPESETKTRVYTANQLGLPLNHSGYFESTCIFSELSSRIPGLAGIIGSAFNLFNIDNCPEQLRESASSSIGYGDCKQHLFEKSCNGQTCYKYIIEAANKAICLESGPNNGKHLNPYYAIAIALNENGGLVSDRKDASQKDHFGCDRDGLIYESDILSKTECMIKTLKAHCGKSDVKNLKNYGYDATYEIGSLTTLGGSRETPLFVDSVNTKNLITSLLDINWQEYYPNEPIESCDKTDTYSSPWQF